MKPWVAPFIIMWAIAATAAAVFFALQTPEPELVETPEAAPSNLETFADRTTERLRRRIERLRAALATALPAVPDTSDGLATKATDSRAQRVLSLLDESRRLEDSEDWTVDASQALGRELTALLATDASTHLALMQRLRESADEDEALDVLQWLVESPFVDLVRRRDVTAAIHDSAREMLVDPRPHIRAAAPRALYGYARATLDDVLAGIARLDVETDPAVREELLAELSVSAKGHGLTIEQARPLIEGLRERSAAHGGGWAAGSLAHWSVTASDFSYIATLLEQATEQRRAQEILNAFQRDTRLSGAHEEASRRILLGVMENRAHDEMVRDLALHFLRGYAPWDDATADAARRYSTD